MERALKRRNWVLKRLLDERFIKLEEYSVLMSEELKLSKSKKILNNKASFFKEEVRREIISRFNEQKLYDSGLTIMTTINEKLQVAAEDSFRKGLRDYSKRSGWIDFAIHPEAARNQWHSCIPRGQPTCHSHPGQRKSSRLGQPKQYPLCLSRSGAVRTGCRGGGRPGAACWPGRS